MLLADTPVAPPTAREVADFAFQVARSGLPLEERARIIGDALVEAIPRAESPDPTWPKATPEQVRLFVYETLQHIDALVAIGKLRGEDWSTHDLDGATSKFNPEIAQFMARPGRDESVLWAIRRHNATPHHAFWNDPTRTATELKESASDIINAWRMERRAYGKPSWSWEKIERTIEVEGELGELSEAQVRALREAIPHQKEYERLHHGRPA
jgi:hypothetical protein